jgi:hypothetical protein
MVLFRHAKNLDAPLPGRANSASARDILPQINDLNQSDLGCGGPRWHAESKRDSKIAAESFLPAGTKGGCRDRKQRPPSGDRSGDAKRPRDDFRFAGRTAGQVADTHPALLFTAARLGGAGLRLLLGEFMRSLSEPLADALRLETAYRWNVRHYPALCRGVPRRRPQSASPCRELARSAPHREIPAFAALA